MAKSLDADYDGAKAPMIGSECSGVALMKSAQWPGKSYAFMASAKHDRLVVVDVSDPEELVRLGGSMLKTHQ